MTGYTAFLRKVPEPPLFPESSREKPLSPQRQEHQRQQQENIEAAIEHPRQRSVLERVSAASCAFRHTEGLVRSSAIARGHQRTIARMRRATRATAWLRAYGR